MRVAAHSATPAIDPIAPEQQIDRELKEREITVVASITE